MKRIDDLLLLYKIYDAQHETLSTGFEDFDLNMPFLKRGTLSILAARPGMGKTRLAMQIAAHLSDDCHTVVFFTSKHSAETLASQIEPMKNQFLATSSKIYIEDRITNVSEFSSAITKADLVPDLIIVDCLQACYITSRKGTPLRDGDRICRKLKELCTTFNCALLCLSTVDRMVDLRPYHRPVLTDIPLWNSMSPHVDSVVFFTRDEYYNDQLLTKAIELVTFYEDRVSGNRIASSSRLIWNRINGFFEDYDPNLL